MPGIDVPLQITFHNMEPDAEIEALVRCRAAELGQHGEGIENCRVVLEIPQSQRYRGKLCDVRIELRVRGGDAAVIVRDAGPEALRHGPHVAIHEAFDEARSWIESAGRRRATEPPAEREAER